ncbi:putative membrane protein (plasmid) [Clostridium botulinum]|uniref:hypothetical protein n=1 Tax=Clostridium botulinum TaxID=1491 RepID=UPI000465F8B6|nr:hypothetical protein [Clostridium botulinum]APR02529.1 putative membrane protein [Clostridium botulinum]QDY27080.1 hypothetical protein CGQ40_20460 [Clostridium botulinum]
MKILLGLLFILTFISWLFSVIKWFIYCRKKNINKSQFWLCSLLISCFILNILNLGIQCIK